MLNVVHPRRSGMSLHDIHFAQPEESSETVAPYPHAFSTFTLFDVQLMHGVWDRRQRSLVIKNLPACMPHQLERSPAEKRQGAFRHFAPICGKLLFCRSDRIGQQLQNVLARDPAATLTRQLGTIRY